MRFNILYKNKGDIARLGKRTFQKYGRAAAYARRSCQVDQTLIRAVIVDNTTGREHVIKCK